MATRDTIKRSATRRSGSGGIDQITSADGSVVLTPGSGTGPVVDLSVVPSGTAGWPIGRTRVYAVDAARPDDSGAGFADPASSSAADYRAASVAAGAVAKKTVAGLAAIFPKYGEGRQVEIQIAAGNYNGTDLSNLLNGVTGYASVVVRGTGTVASAGTTKFDGTQADTTTLGAQTGTGLNATGYNTTASNTQTFNLTKVGGGGPAFAFPNGLPLGIRARFDVATTTALLRNSARQVARVPNVDQISLQTALAAVPAVTDTLYLEQPGVRLTGNLNLVAGGTDGLILVGLAWAGSLNVDPAAGRHQFVFVTFDDAGTETLASATGVVVAQSYVHSVYGTTTPGGGLLVQGNINLTGARMLLEGLVTQLAATIAGADGTFRWGAGCVARNIIVNSCWMSDSDDAAEPPNFGLFNNGAQNDARPTTFGSGTIAAMLLNASAVRFGEIRFNTYAGKAAVALQGKCNVGFVGAPNADSDGSGQVGLDLSASTDSEIRVGSVVPGITGTFGDIAYVGPAYAPWANLGNQETHDAAGNHIYYALPSGQYDHRTGEAIFRAAFREGGFGAIPRYGIVRSDPANADGVNPAFNGNVNDALGLAGIAEIAAGPGFPTAMYIRPLSGCTKAAFDTSLANADHGKTVYLSASVGQVTVIPPTTGPVIPLGVVVANTGTECVVQWNAAGTSGGQANTATWDVTKTRVYAVDLAQANDAGLGYADPATTSAADYAVACAAAGAVAKKTLAGLSAILPRIGNGRSIEIVIAAGTYTGGTDLGALLRGLEGYLSVDVRGTDTVASAGVVKFDGSAADCTVVGGTTVTGLNAAGYNPTGAPTTSVIQCLKVGGAAPAFGAEPAVPMGWRIRFDVLTATAALRNVCRQVSRVSGTDTVYTQTALPAVPAAGDVFYLEQAGVVVDAYTINAPPNGANGIQIVGVVTAGAVTINDARSRLTFCGGSTFTSSGNQLTLLATPQAYTHPVRGSLTVGGGFRATSSASIGSAEINLNGLVCVTDLTLLGTIAVPQWGAGAAARSLTINNALLGAGTTTTNPNVGTSAAVGIPRIFGGGGVGLAIAGSEAQIGAMNIEGVGANPAISLRGYCAVVLSGIVTGTTGNTDVGLDLTNAAGSIVFLFAAPTVTGTAGDVRLAGGQIITWAQALLGIVDSKGNKIIGTSGQPGGMAQFADIVQASGIADTTTYLTNTSPDVITSLGVQQTTRMRYPVSQRLMAKLRVTNLSNTLTHASTVTLKKNDIATAMTVSIPAGSAANTKFVDSAHPVLFADGDDFDIAHLTPTDAGLGTIVISVTLEWFT